MANTPLIHKLSHNAFKLFSAPMPERYKKIRGAKPKGVANRNRGLKWIRQNAVEGVVYFADDDNTYDVRLFNEVNIFIYLFHVPLVGRY